MEERFINEGIGGKEQQIILTVRSTVHNDRISAIRTVVSILFNPNRLS